MKKSKPGENLENCSGEGSRKEVLKTNGGHHGKRRRGEGQSGKPSERKLVSV